jgi:hypothetical protein
VVGSVNCGHSEVKKLVYQKNCGLVSVLKYSSNSCPGLFLNWRSHFWMCLRKRNDKDKIKWNLATPVLWGWRGAGLMYEMN